MYHEPLWSITNPWGKPLGISWTIVKSHDLSWFPIYLSVTEHWKNLQWRLTQDYAYFSVGSKWALCDHTRNLWSVTFDWTFGLTFLGILQVTCFTIINVGKLKKNYCPHVKKIVKRIWSVEWLFVSSITSRRIRSLPRIQGRMYLTHPDFFNYIAIHNTWASCNTLSFHIKMIRSIRGLINFSVSVVKVKVSIGFITRLCRPHITSLWENTIRKPSTKNFQVLHTSISHTLQIHFHCKLVAILGNSLLPKGIIVSPDLRGIQTHTLRHASLTRYPSGHSVLLQVVQVWFYSL